MKMDERRCVTCHGLMDENGWCNCTRAAVRSSTHRGVQQDYVAELLATVLSLQTRLKAANRVVSAYRQYDEYNRQREWRLTEIYPLIVELVDALAAYDKTIDTEP